ncbi:MAG TPA: DUF3536 domain-containing protein [Acidimicrobiales bacterium]|nr:DUF3536 domain-containing protein [Acidimicrobiales bacterium]
MADVAFVLHGHFYQPPRENPWTEVVPRQPSAAPFHDWNERITAECYRPNGWARIFDDHGRIVAIVDNYERLSFNMGPTLLPWLEDRSPEVYERILDADRRTRRAIAQAYGHAILPLCNDRDLLTQIRWGLADFRYRFGREAEGMWLPETAVDERVLAALAEEGVGFTILAPDQIAATRLLAGRGGPDGGWSPATGPDLPGTLRWRHPDDPDLGIDLVVYDGPISHDVAFGGFPSQVVVGRIVRSGARGLVSVACDGETFGHHHPYADRGVAYALSLEAHRRGVRLPRLADWLAEHPPTLEGRVRLSAWSCAHGVGRWKEDCGCHTGGEPGWSQAWRGPLRAALDRVRDAAAEVFERRGPQVLHDPWAARDAYVDLVLGATTVDRFADRHVVGGRGAVRAVVQALTLLESQRHALLMYTSCGWFFNDLAGLETVQIMRYAACCADLLSELGERPPVDEVLAILARGQSNDPDQGDGRAVWERHVEPSRVDPGRVVAHLALTDLLAGDAAGERIAGFEIERELHEAVDRGGVQLCAGRVAITHRRTRRHTTWAYAAVHLGGLEVFGAVRPAAGVRDGDDIAELVRSTRRGERVTGLLRMVVDRFGPREFGLESVLPGVGEDLLRATAQALADRFVAAYDQLRSDHHDTLAALAVAGTPLSPELRGPVELALARRLDNAVAACAGSADPGDYRAVRALAREAREEGVRLASPWAAAMLVRAATRAVEEAAAEPDEPRVAAAAGMVRLVRELAIEVGLDAAQERVYDALCRDGSRAGLARLAPLARRLGVSPEPADLPA